MIPARRLICRLALVPVLIVAHAGQSAGAEAPAESPHLRTAVAERLARAAVLLSRTVPNPTLDDFHAVALTLDKALELDPGNTEILRLEIDAWRTAEEPERELEAIAELVRLDPSDTVAQLRLISEHINQSQRLEDRLAAYARLLGPGGERLDPAIRSRLAFDAALLSREIGDDEGFLRLLSKALELDQTNKPAALMASALFLESSTDATRRCEMLIQLILSDPLDGSAHLKLAQELLAHGAYTGASRFFRLGILLDAKAGRQPAEDLLDAFLTAQWGDAGAEAFAQTLADEEAAGRYAYDIQRQKNIDAGQDPAEIPEYTPNPLGDRTRALIASALGNDEEALRLLTRLSDGLLQGLRAREKEEGADPGQLALLRRRVASEMIRLRAWTGLDLDTANEALGALSSNADSPLKPEAADRYRGLFAAHTGDTDTAVRLLTPLADAGDDLAELGLAIAMETAGRRADAVRGYALLARDHPGSGPGLWARTHLSAMLGTDINPAPLSSTLNALADEAPSELERMAEDPNEYLNMRVTLLGDHIDPLEPLRARIEITNIGVFPLGVGTSAPVNSRVLISPRLTVDGKRVEAGLGPEITSLARRLRLKPNDTVRADVPLGLGPLGAVLDHSTPLAAALRCQGVQGYRYSDETGTYVPDALSLTASTALRWRRPAGEPPALSELTEQITSAHSDELLVALLTVRWALGQPAPDGAEEDDTAAKDALGAALAARYPSLSPFEQAFTLLVVPPGWQTEHTAGLDDAELTTAPDALRTLVMLLTRADSLDHPAFDRAAGLNNATVRDVAAIIHQRLELIERFKALQESTVATPDEPVPTR